MKTKALVIIIAVVLAISLAASAILYFGGERKTANIYVDGKLYRSIDLAAVTEAQTFTVETERGRNVIEVERGRNRVSEADCPDRVCMRSGARSAVATMSADSSVCQSSSGRRCTRTPSAAALSASARAKSRCTTRSRRHRPSPVSWPL